MLRSFKHMSEEKKVYRRLMARAAMLPKDYQMAFRKIQGYLLQFAVLDDDEMIKVQRDILKEFEAGVGLGKTPMDITGWDIMIYTNTHLRQVRADDMGKAA